MKYGVIQRMLTLFGIKFGNLLEVSPKLIILFHYFMFSYQSFVASSDTEGHHTDDGRRTVVIRINACAIRIHLPPRDFCCANMISAARTWFQLLEHDFSCSNMMLPMLVCVGCLSVVRIHPPPPPTTIHVCCDSDSCLCVCWYSHNMDYHLDKLP